MTGHPEPPHLRPPVRDGRRPRLKPPPGACDTHFHIYEPDIPLEPGRRYTPVAAGLADYRAVARRLGLKRGVVITGSAMTSNEPALAAIAAMKGAFKGLALIKPDIPDSELRRLAEGGMTGFRISTRSVGGLGPDHLLALADRVRELGWHVEIHLRDVDEVIELMPLLRRLPVPFSIDHCAYLAPGRGPGTPAFEAVHDLLVSVEDAYVNLYSLYNLSQSGPPHYADMADTIGALIAARPDRLLWGSNWPHPTFEVPVPDEADLLDVLLEAAPDEAHRRLVLSENPARLYGWEVA